MQEIKIPRCPPQWQETKEALWLIETYIDKVWPIEPEDRTVGDALAPRHPKLNRKQRHFLACCLRHRVDRVHTFDGAFAEAFAKERERKT
jgi:predicted nucleic acid-binding protein